MALTVRDLMSLKQMKKMELIAGFDGLDNIVVTSNLADYEFAPGISPGRNSLFEAHSFVVSSLLYAKDNPELIYQSFKSLYDYKVSAFAFRDVIFDTLPPEVIEFADKNNFPVFKFSTDTFFENIIFEIMNAVQNDDSHYLQEENISAMINNTMLVTDILTISKGLSLKFRKYAVGAFIKSESGESPLNAEYLHRLFLTSKGLREKAIAATYKGGLYVLMTANTGNPQKYEIMLSEIIDFLSLDENRLRISLSNPHNPYDKLDYCFRESYFCHIAGTLSSRKYKNYNEIGVYQFSLPLSEKDEYREYAQNLLKPLSRKPELMDTAFAWIECQGIISDTASKLGCHVNTVRYRLSHIKKLLNIENASEYTLFAVLTPAIYYYQFKKTGKEE